MTQQRLLASMAPFLSAQDYAALRSAADLYYNHWTVRLAHIQLIVRRWWSPNWAANLLERTLFLRNPAPVKKTKKKKKNQHPFTNACTAS